MKQIGFIVVDTDAHPSACPYRFEYAAHTEALVIEKLKAENPGIDVEWSLSDFLYFNDFDIVPLFVEGKSAVTVTEVK